MTILSLDEAALVDKNVSQGRLDGIEAMIRATTNNRFHVRGMEVRGVRVSDGEAEDGSAVLVEFPSVGSMFRPGDTVELMACGAADGLYTVSVVYTASGETTLTLTGGPVFRAGGYFGAGYLCLVQYPADVVDGVRSLLTFDRDRAAAQASADAAGLTGVRSKTVSRASYTFGGALVDTTAGTFPEELLAFLTAHRRLSWGR